MTTDSLRGISPERKMLAALKEIAGGSELSAHPGRKDCSPTLTKPEIHEIATHAIAEYYTI